MSHTSSSSPYSECLFTNQTPCDRLDERRESAMISPSEFTSTVRSSSSKRSCGENNSNAKGTFRWVPRSSRKEETVSEKVETEKFWGQRGVLCSHDQLQRSRGVQDRTRRLKSGKNVNNKMDGLPLTDRTEESNRQLENNSQRTNFSRITKPSSREGANSSRLARFQQNEERDSLPICAFREQVLDYIKNNPVTCIQGETGCGKSTKVPQFLLEDALKGNRHDKRKINIAVTQPRRIACIALAKRVAWEMGEELGQSVGFRISGDTNMSSTTKLTFTTTGYLLQVLINDPNSLLNYTHIILDEVHERSVDADFLSLVIKLQKASQDGNNNSNSNIKIIVMSATLQGDIFSRYFATKDIEIPPTIFVGSKRFNVDTLYLDDFIERPKSTLISASNANWKSLTSSLVSKSILVPELLRRNGLNDIYLSDDVQRCLRTSCKKFDREAQIYLSMKEKRTSGNLGRGRKGADPIIMEGFDLLVLDLINHLAAPGESVLVFLPGIGEITDVYETLSLLESSSSTQMFDGIAPLKRNQSSTTLYSSNKLNANEYRNNPYQSRQGIKHLSSRNLKNEARRFRLFVLHSVILREEQEEVFKDPEPGASKDLDWIKLILCVDSFTSSDTVHIILASNVAESSLTLPKVRLVIDFCLRRQLVYDERRHTSSLVRVWTSHASSQQRLGRTGRVSPGICIRLVTRAHYDECMEHYDLPEILTAPLEKLYLQTKQLGYRLAKSFPPASTALILRGVGSPGTEMKFTSSQLLQLTVQPPHINSITRAIDALDEIGALTSNTEDANITTLGRVATHLPLDVRLSRLLFYSIALGVPVDGVILAACLSSQEPFTLPSHLVIPNPQNYSNALQRSFETRVAFDGAHRREGNKINIRLEITRRSKGFSKLHAIVPKRLVHLSTSAVEIATRLRRLLHPEFCSKSIADLTTLLNFLSDEGGVRSGSKFLIHQGHPKISSVTSHDSLFLKGLLAISFSPQFLIGRPDISLSSTSTFLSLSSDFEGKIVSNGQTKSAKKKQNMLKLIVSEGLDPSRSIIIPKLPRELTSTTVFTAALKLILTNIDFEARVVNENSRSYFGIVTFPSATTRNMIQPDVLRNQLALVDVPDSIDDWSDLPLAAHILNHFGGARWEFPVPMPLDFAKLHANSMAQMDERPDESDSNIEDEEETEGGKNEVEESVIDSVQTIFEGQHRGLGNEIYSNFYNHDVMMCQPTNPCLVKWKLLGFWRGTDLDETKALWSGKRKKNANAMVEVQGKCNYRNPIGFTASYPPEFRSSGQQSSRQSKGHEFLLGTYVTQQGTDVPRISRVEGVTLISAHIGFLLLLGCIRQRYDVKYVIRSHAVKGAVIVGLRLCKSNQEIPIRINCSDEHSREPCSVSLEDLVRINRFRKAFSEFLERSENMNLSDISQQKKSPDETGFHSHKRNAEGDPCIFADSDLQLKQALHVLLGTKNGHGPPTSLSQQQLTFGISELIGRVDFKCFMEDLSPLSPESYGGRGNLLLQKLAAISEKKVNSISTAPLFSETSETRSSKPFLKPLSIANVVDSVKSVREEWLERIQKDVDMAAAKQRKKREQAMKASEQAFFSQRRQELQLEELANSGILLPSNLRNPKTIKRWIENELAKKRERSLPQSPTTFASTSCRQVDSDPAIVAYLAKSRPPATSNIDHTQSQFERSRKRGPNERQALITNRPDLCQPEAVGNIPEQEWGQVDWTRSAPNVFHHYEGQNHTQQYYPPQPSLFSLAGGQCPPSSSSAHQHPCIPRQQHQRWPSS